MREVINDFSNDGVNPLDSFDPAADYIRRSTIPIWYATGETKPQPDDVVYSPPIIDPGTLPQTVKEPQPQVIYLSRPPQSAKPMPKPPLSDAAMPPATTTGGQSTTTTTTGGQTATTTADDEDLIFGFEPKTLLLVGGAAAILFFVMGSEKGK